MATRSLSWTTGSPLKTVLRERAGSKRWWNTGTSAFEAYSAANIALYGIASTEESDQPGEYTWTMPAAVPALVTTDAYRAITYQTSGSNLAVADLSGIKAWGSNFGWDGTAFTNVVTGGTLNPAGTYSVALRFRDSLGAAVPNVAFIVVGQGSGVADGSGNVSVNLNAGSFTVRAASGGGVLFADQAITVTGAGQTFTVTGTGSTPPAADAPGRTTAYAYGHGEDDEVAEGLVATVRLVDPRMTKDLWYRRNRNCTSDATGLVSWQLLQDADYQIKFGDGEFVDFRTGTGDTHEITPQVLGRFGT